MHATNTTINVLQNKPKSDIMKFVLQSNQPTNKMFYYYYIDEKSTHTADMKKVAFSNVLLNISSPTISLFQNIYLLSQKNNL